MVSLGIIAVTLNWCDLAMPFLLVGTEFKAGLGSPNYLISLYIVAYGLTRIQAAYSPRRTADQNGGYLEPSLSMPGLTRTSAALTCS